MWNFAASQIAWFAVVLGAAHGYAAAGTAVALLITAAHLALRRDALEVKLAGVAALTGVVVDSTLVISGQVQFAEPSPSAFSPWWTVSLWLAFATTLMHSLRWLTRRPAIAALAGAVGGPMAYLAGAKLGALTVTTPTALPLIAALWALAMFTLSMFIQRASAARLTVRLPA